MWPWAWLTWMDGLSGAASTDGELRAGILGLVGGGGVAYEDGWTGRRVQAMPPQSGVTACDFQQSQV